MTYQGTILNGVVVLPLGVNLPDGTVVAVEAPRSHEAKAAPSKHFGESGVAEEANVRKTGLTRAPEVTDPEERAKILKTILKSMRRNPVPAAAPRWTREELHERR